MRYLRYLDNQDSLEGKNIVITGANSGLGYAFATQCAYKGANIYFACRNKQKAEVAIKRVKRISGNDNLHFLEYDQSSFDAIDYFVAKLESLDIKIDSLVLNAGILRPENDQKTKDGFPLTTGTNYIGEYYLLRRLDNLIKEKNIKQIIIVTSIGRHFAPRHYLFYLKEDYNEHIKSYFSSKRMNYEIAGYLHDKYRNLSVKIMHPGIATTRIVSNELHQFSPKLLKLGNFVLKLIANNEEKSALCLFEAIKDKTKNLVYYYPRGLFHTSGYPGHRKIRNIKSARLVAASNKLLNF